MKIHFCFLTCMLLVKVAVNAQIKVGDNPTNINSASLLELETTNKGLVFPRVALTNVINSNPLPAGLLAGTTVFNTNASVINGNGIGLYVWNGSSWGSLVSSTGGSLPYWSLTGNSGLNASNNFIGTTDGVDFVMRTNNVQRMRILGTGNAGWITMGSATVPRSPVDMAGNFQGKNVLAIQNTNAEGYSSVDLLDNTGNTVGTFGFANPGVSGNATIANKNYFATYIRDFIITTGSTSNTPAFFIQNSTSNIGINTNSPSQKLHVAGNFLLTGAFMLNGAFMPNGNAGSVGQVLKSNGAGAYPTWGSALLKEDFSAIAPLTYNNVTGVFAISRADADTEGYLSSADWNLFNNKISKITLNTPGSIFNNLDSFSIINGLATGTLSLNTQNANTFFAGPESGAAATPGFRALAATDIPSLAANYIQNQTTQQDSSNFNISGSGIIGTDLSVTGISTFMGTVYLGGVAETTTFSSDSILTIFNGVVKKAKNSLSPLSSWSLTGNGGTNPSSDFLGTTDDISLHIRTNNAERMVIDNTGKVGIGTSAPSNALSVLATDPLYLSGLQQTSTFTSDSILIINAGIVKKAPYSSLPSSSGGWSLEGNSGTNPYINFTGTIDAADYVIRTNNIERMRVLGADAGLGQAGFVGIGATDPRVKLDIRADIPFRNVVNIQNTSSQGYSSIDLFDYAGNQVATFGYANTGAASFSDRDYFNSYGKDFLITASTGLNNNNIFLSAATGFVGIGTDAPQQRLHVLENLQLDGAFMPAGNAGTSGYVLTSAGAGTPPTWQPAAASETIKGTININPNISPRNTTYITVNVPGAVTDAIVIVNPKTQLPNGVVIAFSRVISANTIEIGFTGTGNATAGELGNTDFSVIILP